MIDKSIRQHYQTGDKVGPFRRGMEMFIPKVKEKMTPTSLAKGFVERGITKKLAGTGLLSSLGPIGALLALFLTRKGMKYASDKWGKGEKGPVQAFTSGIAGLGFGSPQEGRELRVLENRRANILQRKEEGRNYSERNLDIVTRAIAEAKGLDINNPNEMRNIDKPITQIRTEKSITEPPIIPEEPEVKSPFAKVIPKTPEVIIPHLEGDRTIPTPTLTPDFAFEDAKRAAQEKAEQQRAPISVPVPAHISGGGRNNGQQGSVSTGAGRNPWGRAKGGRIDKALGGRSRDI